MNRGKGAAIRTAVAAATGDFMVPLDADLEYQPEEIPRLLEPVLSGEAEVVYGSRSFGSHSAYSFWYVMGNKAVTTFANVLFNAYIADLETCFKLMPLDLLRSLKHHLRWVRDGGRDHRQAAGPPDPPVRGADHLPGPQPRSGQEDHLAGRGAGDVDPGPDPADQTSRMRAIRGDRQVQCDVLVALSECRNHRTWFADFAKPYLGDHPVEIGSGLGDYAREWIPLVEQFTATDADEALVIGLKKEMAAFPT